MQVHGEHDRHVSRSLRETGIWEPYETELFRALLGPGAVCVDVGANIGYFSVLAAALVGDEGRVYAFEPDPDNCALLRRNAALNAFEARIEVVQGALSTRAGEAPLYLSRDNLGDHQLYPAEEERASVPVRLYRGDEYLSERITRLDLLKVDTQGTEYTVMAGLMPLLGALPAPPRIILELTPFSLSAAGASGRELIELLATLGEPMSIIDHVEHRLAPSGAEALARWCDNVQATEGDRGFMNILVGAAP